MLLNCETSCAVIDVEQLSSQRGRFQCFNSNTTQRDIRVKKHRLRQRFLNLSKEFSPLYKTSQILGNYVMHMALND